MLIIEDGIELDSARINHLFADVRKVYGYSPIDIALNLANAPVGPVGMRDECAGNEQ